MKPSDLDPIRDAVGSVRDKVASLAEQTIGGKEFQAGGKRIFCSHCGNGRFKKGSVLMNSRTMSLLGLDFLDHKATTLMCSECGRIQWYGQSIEPL